jgi:PEP-CTERM motif
MMRAAAFLALTAGLLAATPDVARAATQKLDLTLIVSGGTANQEYYSNSYLLFDPSLGTLNEVSQTISGSLTWTPGGADPSELELFSRRLSQQSSQTFLSSSSTDPRVIDVDLMSEASDPRTLSIFTGIGSIVSFFEARETPRRPRGMLSGVLSGFVTYDYTPLTPAVPEPSTWAMLMIGFAGLGYAAVRRRGAPRPLSP